VYSGITLAEVPAGQGNIGIWLTSGAPCSPGALACAYYPPGTGCSVGSQCGDVYFLSQLPWNTNGAAYDIATVMLHELGHSLGLPHSFNSASVMFPYYQGVRRTLSSFDIDAIRHLYGP
jgi:hypothetical protein